MAKRFLWQFMYWAKTGKRSWGYIFDKKEYRRALEIYKRSQIIKTEREESGHDNVKE